VKGRRLGLIGSNNSKIFGGGLRKLNNISATIVDDWAQTTTKDVLNTKRELHRFDINIWWEKVT